MSLLQSIEVNRCLNLTKYLSLLFHFDANATRHNDYIDMGMVQHPCAHLSLFPRRIKEVLHFPSLDFREKFVEGLRTSRGNIKASIIKP